MISMGYVDFETENAIYRVELVNHSDTLKVNDFKDDVDLVALELSSYSEGYYDNGKYRETSYSGITKKTPFKEGHFPDKIVRFLKRTGKPLFLPDIAPYLTYGKNDLDQQIDRKLRLESAISSGLKAGIPISWLLTLYDYFGNKKISRRGLLFGSLNTFLFSLGLWVNKNKQKMLLKSGELGYKEYIRQYDAFVSSLLDLSILDVRNAVIAEKLERFVAPEMRKRLGRKPIIYFAIGSAHTDIIDCLKNENYRKMLIEKYSPIENKFHPENLKGCLELKFDNGKIFVGEHSDIISFSEPSAEVLQERKRISELLERRLEVEKSRPENMPKKEDYRKDESLSRRDFLRRLRPKA